MIETAKRTTARCRPESAPMLDDVRLAGVPVPDSAVAELTWIVRTAGADVIAAQLEDPLTGSRSYVVAMNEHQ